MSRGSRLRLMDVLKRIALVAHDNCKKDMEYAPRVRDYSEYLGRKLDA